MSPVLIFSPNPTYDILLSDLEVYPPFAPKTVKQSLHKTYLDSAGRPTISFVYGNLTDRHEGFVYVCYVDLLLTTR